MAPVLPPLESLCCPRCLHGGAGTVAGLSLEAGAAVCTGCGQRYASRDGVLNLRYPPVDGAPGSDPARDFYEEQEHHAAPLALWLARAPRDRPRGRPTPDSYRVRRHEVFWASDDGRDGEPRSRRGGAARRVARVAQVLSPHGRWRSVLHGAKPLVVYKRDGAVAA